MILSVIGDTDKRPIMYTLLKVCQYLGDVLLVTNDMDVVAKNCTRVIVVANKEIVFDGVPSDLFSEENRPGIWGLTYPPAVLLGRCLPGAPYCKDMDTFCAKFLEIRKERVR